ncbi:hypothetical protein NXF25_018934 [Crotalus adamanteus]|uniref:Secreted protein n=1 Tax=Crotalus adamanteus TaxID=8729 RepID=A0AAW1B0Q2_CROAD
MLLTAAGLLPPSSVSPLLSGLHLQCTASAQLGCLSFFHMGYQATSQLGCLSVGPLGHLSAGPPLSWVTAQLDCLLSH